MVRVFVPPKSHIVYSLKIGIFKYQFVTLKSNQDYEFEDQTDKKRSSDMKVAYMILNLDAIFHIVSA